MKETPLITIAIPAYKTEYLGNAIESALAQTYRNTEILIVDDSPSADVKGIVDSYSDERVVFQRNESNIGKEDPSRNWQRCLEMARGEYICILCDDDIYAPEHIQTMVDLSEKYPSCSAFRSGVSEINEKGKTTSYYPLAPEHVNVEEYIWHYFSRAGHQTMSEWMLKVSSLKAIGGYVACPKAWGSDCSTVYLLAQRGGVVSSPLRQVFFRKSDLNITGQKFKFIPQKVCGWQKQCDTAHKVLEGSRHPEAEMIMKVVEKECRRRRRTLFKRASVSDLILMIGSPKKYNLSFVYFVMMMLRNPLWNIVAKRKK